MPLSIEGRTVGCLAVSWVDERSLAVDELELLAGLAVDVLATAVVARIAPARDVATGGATMTWSNAGHLPPSILRPDGSTELLATDRHDLLLGVDPHFPRRDHTADLPPAATVLLYTDGLVERGDADLDDGTARLRAILAGLAHLTPDEICDAVLDQMTGRDGEDDVALLAARIAPSARV